MTDPVEEEAYRRARRYVFAATLVVIAVLLALPFLL
jgi:hypothetical protein